MNKNTEISPIDIVRQVRKQCQAEKCQKMLDDDDDSNDSDYKPPSSAESDSDTSYDSSSTSDFTPARAPPVKVVLKEEEPKDMFEMWASSSDSDWAPPDEDEEEEFEDLARHSLLQELGLESPTLRPSSGAEHEGVCHVDVIMSDDVASIKVHTVSKDGNEEMLEKAAKELAEHIHLLLKERGALAKVKPKHGMSLRPHRYIPYRAMHEGTICSWLAKRHLPIH
jgi:hypothetical protein